MLTTDNFEADDIFLLFRNIGKYLKNGISTDTHFLPFTELDFYSISIYSASNLYRYLRSLPSREDLPYYKDLLKYLKTFPLPIVPRLVDREYYKGCPPLFIVRGSDTVRVGRSDFDRVFSILEENHIPTTRGTVMTAIKRYALQEEIFPVLERQNNDKKGNYTHISGNPYVKKGNNGRKSH